MSRTSLFSHLLIISSIIIPKIFAQELSTDNVDLSAILDRGVIYHDPKVFQTAITLVNDLETSPSCHRLAAKNLLESCEIFDRPGKPVNNVALDKIKTTYATRLALCEIISARVPTPVGCEALLPTPEDRGYLCYIPGNHCPKTKTFTFPQVQDSVVDTCLSALEKKTQHWTSYSNARQNAVTLCHAARGEAEREFILDTHRNVIKSTAGLSEEMAKAAQKSNEFLMSQYQFAKVVKDFQSQAARDMQSGQSAIETLFTSVKARVETEFGSMMSSMLSAMTSTFNNVDLIDKKLSSTAENAEKMNAGFDDMTRVQTQQLALQATLHDQSQTLHNDLAIIQNDKIQDITKQMGGILGFFASLTDAVVGIMYKHEALDAKITSTDQQLDLFNNRIAKSNEALEEYGHKQKIMYEDTISQLTDANQMANHIVSTMERFEGLGGFEYLLGFFAFLKFCTWLPVPIVAYYTMRNKSLGRPVWVYAAEGIFYNTLAFGIRFAYQLFYNNADAISGEGFASCFSLTALPIQFMLSMALFAIGRECVGPRDLRRPAHSVQQAYLIVPPNVNLDDKA